jgi:hypothetical protein
MRVSPTEEPIPIEGDRALNPKGIIGLILTSAADY